LTNVKMIFSSGCVALHNCEGPGCLLGVQCLMALLLKVTDTWLLKVTVSPW
jgi:hypothetical protein